MEIILTLTERDIRPHQEPTPESEYVAPRRSTRVVIFDENENVALCCVHDETQVNGFQYSMIGGGINEGESIENALTREALEEAGCNIKNIQELGIIEERGIGSESKGRFLQTNYCFIADIDGKKADPQFTEEDIHDELTLKWLPLDEAITNLKNQKDGFVTRKTLFLLEESKKFRNI